MREGDSQRRSIELYISCYSSGRKKESLKIDRTESERAVQLP